MQNDPKTVVETPAAGTLSPPSLPAPEQKKVVPTASETEAKIAELKARPRRHPAIHWAAAVLSVISLAPPIFWLAGSPEVVSPTWVWFDIGMSIFFVFEYFTRSGFRWDPWGYTKSRFFVDFPATVPVWSLIYFNVPWLGVWVWIILIARVVRMADRFLGDGFIRRNVLALVDGLMEEITDRVTVRLIGNMEEDLTQGKVTQSIGRALETNKEAMLERIRAQHPSRGAVAGIMHVTKADAALEKVEEKTYDSLVAIVSSPELERTVNDVIRNTLNGLIKSIGTKQWRKNFGFRGIRRPSDAQDALVAETEGKIRAQEADRLSAGAARKKAEEKAAKAEAKAAKADEKTAK